MRASPNMGRDLALLVLLATMWGSAFVFIKLGVATVPPFTLAAARIMLALVLMLAYLRLRRLRLPRGRVWLVFALLGLVGNVAPFVLISWGEIIIDSALAAILMAVGPLFTVLLAHAFTGDERLTSLKLLGVLIGLSGVVVLIGADALAGLGDNVAAQLAVTAGAFGFAGANVLARRLPEMPPAVAGAATLVAAAVLAVPLSLLVEQPWNLAPSAASLGAIAVLAVWSTALAYLVFFRLVASGGATFVSLNNYLIPLVGLAWGALALGEGIGGRQIAALGLVLLGIFVTNDQLRRRLIGSD